MRSIARRMEEEFSNRVKKESRGALQQGDARSTPTGVRIVHKRSNSDIHTVQKVWRERVSCGGK